jgi:hypothetical protein
MSRKISKRFMRRVFCIMAAEAVIFGGLGYALAPSTPYLFVHLMVGSYVGEYRTQAECDAARRAFAAGRGIDTSSRMTISGTYVDMCGKDIPSLNAGP